MPAAKSCNPTDESGKTSFFPNSFKRYKVCIRPVKYEPPEIDTSRAELNNHVKECSSGITKINPQTITHKRKSKGVNPLLPVLEVKGGGVGVADFRNAVGLVL